MFPHRVKAKFTILKVESVDIAHCCTDLYAKTLEEVNINDLITNIGPSIRFNGVPTDAASAAASKAAQSEPTEFDVDMIFRLTRKCASDNLFALF